MWPHGIDVDKQGNVWVVDARSATPAELTKFPDAAGKGHTVLKFSPQGKLLLTLGTPGTAGNPPQAFTEPNDVADCPRRQHLRGRGAQRPVPRCRTRPTGVGRISKFTADGKFIKSFGIVRLRAGPVPRRRTRWPSTRRAGCSWPTAATAASRSSIRTGKHLDTWYQFSRISGLHIAADDTLYAIDSESDDNYNPGWRKGLRVGSARTGEVWYFVPEHVSKQASGMGGYGSMGEGVTVDRQGNVYAGEVGPDPGPHQVHPAPQALVDRAAPTLRRGRQGT